MDMTENDMMNARMAKEQAAQAILAEKQTMDAREFMGCLGGRLRPEPTSAEVAKASQVYLNEQTGQYGAMLATGERALIRQAFEAGFRMGCR